MSLRPAKLFLPSLAFILLLRMGSTQKAAPPRISVIQMPASLNIEEGSPLSMDCQVEGNTTGMRWFINWYRNTSNRQEKLQNSTQTQIVVNKTKISSNLTLKAADLVDSGTYWCSFGSLEHVFPSNGTQVTISEITDFVVRQSPDHITKVEGENVSMECRFRTVDKGSTMYVKWSKDGAGEELAGKAGSRILTQDLEKGLASLILANAHVDDSGSYKCEVGSSARNRSGLGPGSYVVITAVQLVVRQTPAFIHGGEGENLTLNCSIGVAKHLKLQDSVTWYKDDTALAAGLYLPAEGLATLLLRNIRMEDSGTYRCVFGNRGKGNGTRVKVFERKTQSGANGKERVAGGVGVGIGAGIGVGIFFLLLLLSILVWRCKKSAKGTPAGTSDELQKYPPLTTQASEVTYANLRFNKREVHPETEVVYAEVKRGSRQ